MPMNAMDYKLSKQAVRELQEIYDYTLADFGQDQADKYYKKIKETLLFLCDHPHAGRIRPDIQNGIYSIPCKSHMILYKIMNDKTIFIVTIKHSSQDWTVLPQ